MLPLSPRQKRKVSLFSPLLPLPVALAGHKRCPIKGLSAELPVLCQDFRLLSGPTRTVAARMQKHSNDPRMTLAKVDAHGSGLRARRSARALAAVLASGLLCGPVLAQSFPNLPITPTQ